MKENKLIPMVEFILEIDWLTTKEFCEKYNVPLPVFTGEIKSSADQFLQINAIKQKMFVEYAKFLNSNLNVDMFIGQRAVFDGFVKCSQKEALYNNTKKSFDYFGVDEFSMTLFRKYSQDRKECFVTSFHLKKIVDLVAFGLSYNDR